MADGSFSPRKSNKKLMASPGPISLAIGLSLSNSEFFFRTFAPELTFTFPALFKINFFSDYEKATACYAFVAADATAMCRIAHPLNSPAGTVESPLSGATARSLSSTLTTFGE
jgi:hypothetical protein